MSLMGSGSNIFVLATMGNTDTSVFILYLLSKSDGSIIKSGFKINEALDGGLTTDKLLCSNMHTLGYDLISATSATTIYMAIGTADNNQMGILKLDNDW